MAKALRVFAILLLLASGGALYFGITLYNQRFTLKARQEKLEAAVMKVAQKLASPREPYIEAIPEKIDPNALKSFAAMDAQIAVLDNIVSNRWDDLYNTEDELKKTKDELTKTQQELAQTKQELDDARKEIASLTEKLQAKEAELAQANQKIATLDAKVAELNQTISDQKDQIGKLEEEKQSQKDEIQRLEAEVARLTPPDANGTKMKPGLAGSIAVVNAEWNFVILDIGTKDGIAINGEMMVHRGDQLLGKIRIVDAKDHQAIANIQRDWQSAPIQEGDRVLY